MRIYFFFQAEDGIRDLTVTGVQTCALPISSCGSMWRAARARARAQPHRPARSGRPERADERSEERRVGKECRSRGSPPNSKKIATTEEVEDITLSRMTQQRDAQATTSVADK